MFILRLPYPSLLINYVWVGTTGAPCSRNLRTFRVKYCFDKFKNVQLLQVFSWYSFKNLPNPLRLKKNSLVCNLVSVQKFFKVSHLIHRRYTNAPSFIRIIIFIQIYNFICVLVNIYVAIILFKLIMF